MNATKIEGIVWTCSPIHNTETCTPLGSPTGLVGTHTGSKDPKCPINMKGIQHNGTNYPNQRQLHSHCYSRTLLCYFDWITTVIVHSFSGFTELKPDRSAFELTLSTATCYVNKTPPSSISNQGLGLHLLTLQPIMICQKCLELWKKVVKLGISMSCKYIGARNLKILHCI